MGGSTHGKGVGKYLGRGHHDLRPWMGPDPGIKVESLEGTWVRKMPSFVVGGLGSQ